MADIIGKSGTLMAAALETAGYLYQGHVLEQLETAFEGSLGGFIFLVGIVVAICHFAIKGSFKLAPWLIIGPPMFLAAVMPRTTIQEAQWVYGGQPRNQARVTARVDDITGENAGNVEVSKLFARYVELVSEVVQEVVKRINVTTARNDRLLVFRGDMLSFLYSGQIEDQDFFFFVHDAFFHQCRRYIYAASIIDDNQMTPTERSGAEASIGSLNRLDTDPAVTLRGRSLNYYYSLTAASSTWEEAVRRIQRFFGLNMTCRRVWELTHQGIMSYMRRRVDEIGDRSELNQVQRAEMLQQLATAVFGENGVTAGPGQDITAANTAALARAAALYLFRNEWLERTHAPTMLDRGGDLERNASTEVIDEDNFYQVERARVASLEFAEKTRVMMAAENLPYYQGLGLFFLAVAFPFFAMLLLVPGKHAGFLLWFVLWLWVKSWDIGIAVVAMLDKLLFTLLGYHQVEHPRNQELPEDFGAAMVALMHVDPTFQLSTYYNILGVSLLSIPVVSSQLIMGSLTGGAGLIAAGMSHAAQTMAGAAQVAQQQTAVSELRFQFHDRRREENEAANDLLNNREVATQRQRDNYRVGSAEYRRDVLEFGFNTADRIAALPAGQRDGQRTTERGGPNVPRAQQQLRMRYQAGVQARAFLDSGRLNQRLRSLQAMANNTALLGRYTGVLREFEGPTAWMAWGNPNNPVRQAINNNVRSLGGGHAYQSTLLQQEFAQMETTVAVVRSWTNFNLTYHRDQQALAGRARVWGMLEVPWTAAAGAVEDDQYDQQMRTEYVSRQAAIMQAMANIMQNHAATVTGAEQFIRNPELRMREFRSVFGDPNWSQADRDAAEQILASPLVFRLFGPRNQPVPDPGRGGHGPVPNTLEFFMSP